jgi:hypothetical protein
VVADAAARAIRQAGDGAIALEDPAQIVNQRADLTTNLRALGQALALVEFAWRNRRMRKRRRVLIFRMGRIAARSWSLDVPLWRS